MIKKLFSGSIGQQTFFILLMGFVIIQGAGLALYSFYNQYEIRNPSHNEIVNQIGQLAMIAHIVPYQELQHIIEAADSPTLQLSLDTQPIPNAPEVTSEFHKSIRQIISRSSLPIQLSIRTADKTWINVRANYIRNQDWLMIGLVMTLSFMAIASIFLCAWAIRRLAMPLTEFVNAAKRLAIDVNAAPLAEKGPVEIREAARAFNVMQNNIRRLINNRTLMLAAISHDLRTPLTRLKLRAEVFEPSAQFEKIMADVNEMENMISATLHFAQDDYQQELMERFDLDALLESLCNNLIDMGYEVNFNSTHQRLVFLGRPNSLKRAFGNLIENAVKYGKVAQVTLTEKQNNICIEISDQGPGIPENELEKAFQPFYRVEKSRSRSTGGVGLGLAVAREIIHTHSGEIVLYNLPEGGLKVVINLVRRH